MILPWHAIYHILVSGGSEGSISYWASPSRQWHPCTNHPNSPILQRRRHCYLASITGRPCPPGSRFTNTPSHHVLLSTQLERLGPDLTASSSLSQNDWYPNFSPVVQLPQRDGESSQELYKFTENDDMLTAMQAIQTPTWWQNIMTPHLVVPFSCTSLSSVVVSLVLCSFLWPYEAQIKDHNDTLGTNFTFNVLSEPPAVD